jgi:phosphatidylglycerol---prolipoprotein diacylglyceryl transferase
VGRIDSFSASSRFTIHNRIRQREIAVLVPKGKAYEAIKYLQRMPDMFAIGLENQLYYGITLLTGSLLALGIGWHRCVKAKIATRKIVLATVLLPVFVAFFSHLLYCLVDLEYTIYSYSFGYLFAFWENGYMLYGGMLGAVLALLMIGGKDTLKLLEQVAPSGALMIAVARIGEGFLGQGYGEYWTGESVFRRFPFMVYDPYYEEWGWALFILEALIALILFIYLLQIKMTWQGDGALLLFGLYASAQIVLESLRRDEYLRWGFVRVEEVASAVLVLVVLVCYCWKAGKGKGLSKALCFSLYIVMTVFCLLLEFATEGRIPFLTFMDVDACYAAMAVACVLLGASVLWMRHIGNASCGAERKGRSL